ncbi:MAG: Crp/Fnr family transcriptional regulator [Bacteroidia bacterium]|nr:Crp/Fnr family transcriptional regulator [Bacteroidia bacterium]
MIDPDILLALGATYKKVTADEAIFEEGSPCNYYLQLASGRVKCININEDGKEYLQLVVEPGESFGLLPLFDGKEYASSAIALEDCVIFRLHKAIFQQLLQDFPEIHSRFSVYLTERLRFKFFLLREFFYSQPEKRISSLLTYLKKNNKNYSRETGRVKLTRQQIANMTCLRVETVIRAMRRMHENGEITIKHGKVYVGKPEPVQAFNDEVLQ